MHYSVMNFGEVIETWRFDADFYRSDYLLALNKIKKKKYEFLKTKKRLVFSGPFGSFLKSESYRSIGKPFIRISDIKDVYIEKKGKHINTICL